VTCATAGHFGEWSPHFWSIPRDMLAGAEETNACFKRSASRGCVSVGLVLGVTAGLWRVNSTATGSYHLVYFYLFPVALIAGLYKDGLALLATAIALICADYFLQKPYTFSAIAILSNPF
jgi:K+-sensing histidine kinase KdpD